MRDALFTPIGKGIGAPSFLLGNLGKGIRILSTFPASTGLTNRTAMNSNTWKYVENTFEVNTRNSRAKMDKIVQDHDGKLKAAAAKPGADANLVTLNTAWTPRKAAWDKAYSDWKIAKARYGGSTSSFEALLNELQKKPAPTGESKIEEWDRRIRGDAPKGSPLYQTLLPRGRAPFNSGGRDAIVRAVKDLGELLSEQTTKPALVTLGGEVTAFHDQLDEARTTQQGMEGDTDTEAAAIETARKAIATALFGNLGMLMFVYQDAPTTVTGFFDLDTLRQAAPPPAGGQAQASQTPPAP